MTDLAAALEAAEQGSRELSDRVLLKLGFRQPRRRKDRHGIYETSKLL